MSISKQSGLIPLLFFLGVLLAGLGAFLYLAPVFDCGFCLGVGTFTWKQFLEDPRLASSRECLMGWSGTEFKCPACSGSGKVPLRKRGGFEDARLRPTGHWLPEETLRALRESR